MHEYQSFLISKLSDIKKRNPHFSLRAFAKHLDLSPALLSMLINGKKKLTQKQAYKIIKNLNLTSEEAENFLGSCLPNYLQMKFKNTNLKILTEDEFKLISEWYHFAILSLSKIKKNKSDPKWVAQRLGIDTITALDAIKRLERLDLLKIENAQLVQTNKSLTTQTEIPSQAIRNYHKQNLKIAEDKVESISLNLREFSSSTLAVRMTDLPKAKKMIQDFKLLFCREIEPQDPDSVYTLAIQFFPLTNQELQ